MATVAGGMPILSLFVFLAALGLAALFRPDARAAMEARNRRYAEAKRSYAAVEKEWTRAARNTRFAEARDELVKAKRALSEQKSRYQAEFAGLGKHRARKELEAFLERHIIAAHPIADIGKRTQALLLSFGIETAADVTDAKLARIPTLSNERKQNLLAWRKSIERRFRFNPKRGIDAAYPARVDVAPHARTPRKPSQAQRRRDGVAAHRLGDGAATPGAAKPRRRTRRSAAASRSGYERSRRFFYRM